MAVGVGARGRPLSEGRGGNKSSDRFAIPKEERSMTVANTLATPFFFLGGSIAKWSELLRPPPFRERAGATKAPTVFFALNDKEGTKEGSKKTESCKL